MNWVGWLVGVVVVAALAYTAWGVFTTPDYESSAYSEPVKGRFPWPTVIYLTLVAELVGIGLWWDARWEKKGRSIDDETLRQN